MAGFDGGDYIEVAARVNEFFRRYPKGSIQAEPAHVVMIGERAFIAVEATAYRTPDDERPGIAQAWEPFPGKTNFTRDSEAMNAETSAIGRALAALGVETKKSLATKGDVDRRRAEQAAARIPSDDTGPAERSTTTLDKPDPWRTEPTAAPADSWPLNDGGDRERRSKRMFAMFREHAADMDRAERLAFCATVVGRPIASSEELRTDEFLTICDRLKALPKAAAS